MAEFDQYKQMQAESDTPSRQVQALFVQNASRVRGFIAALLPDVSQIDDVLQETFLTVTAKAETFDVSRDFLPWACGIARFKVMEAGRRSAKRWQPLSDEVIDALVASEPTNPSGDDRAEVLAGCIEKLSKQARRIIELRYRQSHTPEEISRSISSTVDSVYVALSRARTALRGCVERQLLGSGGEA